MRKTMFLGGGLIFIGLVCNHWLLGAYATSGSKSALTVDKKLVIWLFQAICILVGYFLYTAKTLEHVKKILFSLILCLMMFLFVEGTFRMICWIVPIDSAVSPRPPKPFKQLPYYQDKTWIEEFTKEHDEVIKHFKFVPFVGITRQNYYGTYINIDEEGARKTWNSQTLPDSNSKIVFMFGGSAMFGYGSRDDYTIASRFSQILNQNESETYYVYNYGQFGYTFLQELIKLFLLLRDGKRPDYVIFFDGVNEVGHAYVTGELGMIAPVKKEQQKTSSYKLKPMQRIFIGLEKLTQKMVTYRVLREITRHLEAADQKAYDEQESKAFAERIIQFYLQSHQMLIPMAEMFGFQYLCTWQPVLFEEKQVVEKEHELRNPKVLQNARMRALYCHSYDLIRKQPPPHFIDLSGCLSDRNEPLYVDFCHINEKGEEVVAKSLYNVFREHLLSERPDK